MRVVTEQARIGQSVLEDDLLQSLPDHLHFDQLAHLFHAVLVLVGT